MKFAKALSNHMPKQFSLKKHLHEHMGGFEKARPITMLHASELTKTPEFCPRAYALMESYEVTPPAQYVETSLRYTYDMGRMLEQSLRESWAGDITVGDWNCGGCGKTYEFQFRPHKCSCGAKQFKYRELRFTSVPTGASGGMDLLVRLPGYQKATLVEAKSMEKDAWADLKAPLAEHRLRTNLYLRLIEESDNPNKKFIMLDRAIILYMVKGFGKKDPELSKLGIKEGFSPFKEYVISRDDSQTDALMARAKQWNQWKLGTGLLPDPICLSRDEYRACKCPVVQQCFLEDVA